MMGLPKHPSLPLVVLVLFLTVIGQIGAQLSDPIAHDTNMRNTAGNKFLQRAATNDAGPAGTGDEEPQVGNTECPKNAELRWMTEVSSSIYSSPLIADINSDGRQEVVVASFVHYLEVLEGSDGEKLPGWPAFHKSSVHTSPFLYDIDGDGKREVGIATYNGEILFFRPDGSEAPQKLTVPRLRIRKDWYVGLNPDHVDHSRPDVGDNPKEEEPLLNITKPAEDAVAQEESTAPVTNATNVTSSEVGGNATEVAACEGDNCQARRGGNENISSEVGVLSAVGGGLADAVASAGNFSQARRRLLQAVAEGIDPPVPTPLLTMPEPSRAPTAENVGSLDPEAADTFSIFGKSDDRINDPDLGGIGHYDFDDEDYIHAAEMWRDEDFFESAHQNEADFVHVDAHILCTPVVGDIDNDGQADLVVAASFFFDREYYDDPKHAGELPQGIDMSKYIAGGVVVFDLVELRQKWLVHLDLTTDSTAYRAYIYSAPTIVDLDRDGQMEVLVGTSVGFVYCLDSTGKPRENFPIQMGEVQGQVVAADINGDDYLEIVAMDTRGNVAAFTWRGQELWERHVGSLIAQGATVGDVDGDGSAEVCFASTSGNVYAVRGDDGKDIQGFPFKTRGRVMSPVLLLNMMPSRPRGHGLDLVVTSFDGYVYMIEGETGCADAIDVGETSYSMVLAENVDGGDDLDLIVTTMNGNVYCFQTPARHHPMKAWPMQNHGRNAFTPREVRGIFALPHSRKFRDLSGESFPVRFRVVDVLPVGTRYNVTITLMVPNYGPSGDRVFRLRRIYHAPGIHMVRLPVPRQRLHATVLLEMTDQHGIYYSDEFAVSFNMYFYRVLKWILVLPLLAMAAPILLSKPSGSGAPLPTVNMHEL